MNVRPHAVMMCRSVFNYFCHDFGNGNNSLAEVMTSFCAEKYFFC